MSFHILVISQTNVIKYMLLKPMIHGRIGKWMLTLIEFSLQYVPTEHPNVKIDASAMNFMRLKGSEIIF